MCQRLRARCHLAADLFDEPVEAVAADGACSSVGFGKLSSEAILLVDEKREAFPEHLQVAAEASDLQAPPVEPGTEPFIQFVATLPRKPGVELGHQSVRASHAWLCGHFFPLGSPSCRTSVGP